MYKRLFVTAIAVVLLGAVAYAELQNVEVGGKIRIRGNWVDFDKSEPPIFEQVINKVRSNFVQFIYPQPLDFLLRVRPEDVDDLSFVEQRTRLNVKADFTDEVTAFVEFDSYDVWGEDFRSVDYITGFDARQITDRDVEIYQAYIEAREMWGTPLRMRVGRQEMTLGSGWLVGTNDKNWLFYGLSFDALRLSYVTDQVSIDAFAAKLAELYGDFGEDDLDLYGVYGSYTGLEDIVIDAYWLYLRDDRGIEDTFSQLRPDLHTVGLRAAGKVSGFDFEAEVAYQFGDVDDHWQGIGIRLLGRDVKLPIYNDVDLGAWGVNLELGYTFDVSWQPRVYAGFAYFQGDETDYGLGFNLDIFSDVPFGLYVQRDITLPFNRLFSNWEYSDFLDIYGDLTNALIYRLGVDVQPTEAIKVGLVGKYLTADESEGDNAYGWEVGVNGSYQYSEDLVFRAGYSHFFGKDYLEDQDFNYAYVEAEISF